MKIGSQIFQINHLIKSANLDLVASQLPQKAKTQLKVLLKTSISKQQLDEFLIKILVFKKQKTKLTQNFNLKSLIIGFSVAGGVLVVSSVVGCSIYYFFSIKKNIN